MVSVILPTFNRARFLPEAFASIAAQSFTDWELIVVDDGSTDDTASVVAEWRPRLDRPFTYVRQENGGAYSARNRGLDEAAGDYIAFFDSDDLWLPHHLERCVAALERAPDADWVYAACRAVDAAGTVVTPTTFETGSRPRPFLSLQTRRAGDLHVITDPRAIECQLTYGLYAGLQNSVIRRAVFQNERFWPEYRVVEDVLFLIRAMLRGVRLGYIDAIHVIYRIHEGNSSASASGISRQSLYKIRSETVDGLERIRREHALNRSQDAALRRALAGYYFWELGYVCSLEAGDMHAAFEAFHKALALNPYDWRMWKTYAVARVRTLLGGSRADMPSH